MPPLDPIVAATDLSAPARHAIERAALVSLETAMPLHLLHVANLAPLERLRQIMAATSDDMQQQVLDAARTRLDDLSSALQKRFGVLPEREVVAGALLAELTRKVGDLEAGLLVCGSKGESVIRRLLMGTTALRLLSTAPCPVLVVKQVPHETYRRLLVPVDFSASSQRSIRLARRLAPNAEIVLLHAFELPFEGTLRYASVNEPTINHYQGVARQEAMEKLHALRDEAGLSARDSSLMVLHGDPAACIVEQEQEQDCDLIVIGKHGESMLEDLLLGSVTEHVLSESQSDVLVSV